MQWKLCRIASASIQAETMPFIILLRTWYHAVIRVGSAVMAVFLAWRGATGFTVVSLVEEIMDLNRYARLTLTLWFMLTLIIADRLETS